MSKKAHNKTRDKKKLKKNAHKERMPKKKVQNKMIQEKRAPKERVQKKKAPLSLVERCKSQMSASLLRLMDEALYTSDTKNISLDKEKFDAYHSAYESVSKNWPSKPIDYIVKFIKKRLLPKNSIKKMKFADIGCGREPLLKKKLPSKSRVLSFDLVAAHEDITEANMEDLPIEDGAMHCTVYSLSLMAKNLGQILLEGKRILKIGGSMLIVEVTSRFEGNEKKFVRKMEKIGLKQKSMTQLKPNGYFTFFHFTKADNESNYSNSSLDIQLKPCVYKAR